MIGSKLAGFVVIVHVGTNNTVDSVSVCIDKYCQLAQGIIQRNPMVHVAFFCHSSDNYIKVNAALMQYCHEGGFTVLGGLVDDWPSYLSRDGVPSRFGNRVLTEYLYQVACTLSIHLERSHIQQHNKETRAPSSWTSWTRQDKHPCHHRGGVSSTWFAYFHFFSCSKWTFHSTSSCLESQHCSLA
ncbi:hypothetical protein HPB49_010686 [Dermacentor silvarum]|uniref:Uncharacterized protein n=1 Tax=Dermacentor silvarum TaxID=543639 RepID=A0ACB8DZE5_DERSI|nr:hypothetical protein HPB49_010686 [Dermacentor silvarum]